MRMIKLGEIAQACGGDLFFANQDQSIQGISTDSRAVQPGELFIALKGDRFDAHQFMTPEMVSRLSGALVTRNALPSGLPKFPLIDVPDVRKAMGQLAHWYRTQFQIPVIGITGSNGKTSTKALLKGAMSQGGEVLSSPASFNNDVGVPLTLLDLSDEHQAAILEIGTNHPGEIAHLSSMVQPTHAIITSVGGSHIGNFGSVEAIAQEKGCLAEALPENGVLFLNSDSPWFSHLAKRTAARLITVGFSESSDWRLSKLSTSQQSTQCQISNDELGIQSTFIIPVSGRHQAVNAGLAFAMAIELGLSPEQVTEGLSKVKMPGMRMEVFQTKVATFWNDAYNANEDSVLASMETFCGVAGKKSRTVMVLGQLNELGDHASAVYQRLADKAVNLGIDLLVGVGEGPDAWVDSAKSKGHSNALNFASNQDAFNELRSIISHGDQILFKASRGAKLEGLVEQLRSAFENPEPKEDGHSVDEENFSNGSTKSSPSFTACLGGMFL